MTTTVGPTGTFQWGSAAPTSKTTTSSSTAATKDPSEIDKDTFLKLLVAQMKYQDPSNPTDPTQFMTQTAQFTMVDKLNQIAGLSQQQTATSLVGRSIQWTGADGKSQTGTVTGATLGTTPSLIVGAQTVALNTVTSVGTAATTGTTGSTGTSGSTGTTGTSGTTA